jgi:hypothetical protein
MNKKRHQPSSKQKSKSKHQNARPKTSHNEVFLAYSYMKKVAKPKGIKSKEVTFQIQRSKSLNPSK